LDNIAFSRNLQTELIWINLYLWLGRTIRCYIYYI